MDSKLPPMPESDSEALEKNKFHNYYKVGAKDFWGDAEISYTRIEDFKDCKHYFERKGYEIECRECHLGWQAPGTIQVQNGQLVIDGQIQQFQLAH